MNVDVSLGNLYVSDFPNAGSGSPWVNFDLSLTGCQNMNTVRATFSGTADGQTYYANTGNAGGIKIEIQDRDGSMHHITMVCSRRLMYKIIMQPLILKPVQ